jgi:hypothetical protein
MANVVSVPTGVLDALLGHPMSDTTLSLAPGEHDLPLDITDQRRVIVQGSVEDGCMITDSPFLPEGARTTIWNCMRLRFEDVKWATKYIIYVVSGDKVEFADCELLNEVKLNVGNGAEVWMTDCASQASVLRARNGGTIRLNSGTYNNLQIEDGSVLQFSGDVMIGNAKVRRARLIPLDGDATINGQPMLAASDVSFDIVNGVITAI